VTVATAETVERPVPQVAAVCSDPPVSGEPPVVPGPAAMVEAAVPEAVAETTAPERRAAGASPGRPARQRRDSSAVPAATAGRAGPAPDRCRAQAGK